MPARLIAGLVLAAGACAASDPYPLAGGGPGSLSSPGFWLARADAAEERGDAAEALLCLERWARDFPERVEDSHRRRRLRLALAAGDEDAALRARHALLEAAPADEALRLETAGSLARSGAVAGAARLLEYDFEDPGLRQRAWQLRAECLAAVGEPLAAAALMERAAQDPAVGEDAARACWERASRYWESGGDAARATAAIERALAGVELGAREQAALQRLRAFGGGELASVEDATAVLRFHDDPERRLDAARFLAARPFDDAVAVFGRALGDPDGRVVALALEEIFGRHAEAERAYAAACARPLCADPREEVALAALALLGATGAESDLPRLLDALDPADRARFRAARRALERLTGHAEPAPLDPDLAGRERLREAWRLWWQQRDART